MNVKQCVSRYRSRAWFRVVAVAIALCSFSGRDVRAATVQPLEIVTKTGVHVFSVEMATTEEEKTTGLMYRKELADGKRMMVDFIPAKEIVNGDEKNLYPARNDFHSGRWQDSPYRGKSRAAIDQDHPVAGAGE